MLIIGIILAFVALAYLCWLLFALVSLCIGVQLRTLAKPP
jgi:hypothetical protein